jgi:hypothetical protein
VDGKVQGQGYAHGSWGRYVGEFKNSSKHGQGVLTYPTGEMLRGEFRQGKIYNGEGMLKVEGSKDYYVGSFLEGGLAGEGAYVRHGWSTYVGEFVHQKYHGQGTLTYDTGETLKGEFRKGKIWKGDGVLKHPSTLNVYVGTWEDGQMQGQATVYLDGFATYVGNVYHGLFDREGVLTYDSGGELRGEFVQGKIYDGKGVLKFADSRDFMEGKWVMGKMEGFGKVYKAHHSTYVGLLAGGSYHGQGTLTYENGGGTVRGVFRNGQIVTGEGSMVDESGKKVVGRWDNGEFYSSEGRT